MLSVVMSGEHLEDMSNDDLFWRKFVDLDSDSDNEISVHDIVVNYDSYQNSNSIQSFIYIKKTIMWACNESSVGTVKGETEEIK